MARKQEGTGVRPINAALKTLAVLDALANARRAMRLADIASAVGESRPTTYQKLLTLAVAGWVEQTPDGTYRLALQVTRFGEAALEQASFGERATTTMQALVAEVGETASLAVLSDVHARLIKRVEAEVDVRAEVRVGTMLSLDNSSSGRVLTAFATAEQRALLERLGGVLASEAVLRAVRRNGYAVSTGKDRPGVRSAAAPVFDARETCVAALSVVAPVSRFEPERWVEPLREAARKISALMSGRSPLTAAPRASAPLSGC